MKKHHLALFVLLLLVSFSSGSMAQTSLSPIFSDLFLEARADFEYNNFRRVPSPDNNTFGFRGRYFNLRMGGELGGGFSYFLRQRIIARPGSTALFDNTDFLYLNYQASDHFSFRIGKDALYVGGYEYDAPPIDVYFNSYYWDEYNCFQLAASTAYTFADGKQKIGLQVAASPYIYSMATHPELYDKEYTKSLLSYNLMWNGTFGHFNTLYSVNMFERKRGSFMNVIALGHKLIYDNWDIYLDFMHYSLGTDDWGKCFGLVSCANYKVLPWLNLFAKGGYETNHSKYECLYAEYANGLSDAHNILARPETDSYYYGLGVEIVPTSCSDVRLHCCLSQYHNRHPDLDNPSIKTTDRSLYAKVGVTWFIDIHRMVVSKLLK